MQNIAARLRQSASLKVFVIGFLILVLLIPLAMIRDVIFERDQVSEEARHEIQQTWGRPQLIAGPVLVVPYKIVHSNNRGERFTTPSNAYVLPETLNVEVSVDSEIRSRGIHDVAVYSSRVRLHGLFPKSLLGDLKIADENADWSGAYVALGVRDGRAITETPEIVLHRKSTRFVPGGQQIAGLPPQIIAPVGKNLETSDAALPFEIVINVNGSESLSFLPMGDTTNVSMRSSWPSPSFSGNYLPENREISDTGFTASWKISSIGRPLPSRWVETTSAPTAAAENSAFGVDLYMPISVYRLTLRATKYGILFIGLTFVAYFLFEIVAGLRVHPLQYLLVGFANSLFYLLLVSLAEHIGFGWAYLASCAASAGLIVGYSLSVLGERRRAIIMAVILGLLYSFLYMTLKAETYAMLAGSIGLWLSLGIVMYLTRGIDWYARGSADQGSTQGELL